MSGAVAQYTWLNQQGEAPGAPGGESRWTSSVKDTVGTAYSASSRVWYTVSHGILNEIYYPTIDRPQTRDMGLLITDGESFFHEEKRDLEHKSEYVDETTGAPAVRVTSTDPEGRYSLVKEIISDPHAPVVLMRVAVQAEPEMLRKLKFYALLAPHIDGGGENNSGRVLDVAGKRVLLAWKEGTTSSLAMTTHLGFSRASCGYVGVSDGWQDLRNDFAMHWEYGSACNGNIALTGEIILGELSNREYGFVVAIGFGEGHHAALSATVGSLAHSFSAHATRFLAQWGRSTAPAELATHAQDGGRLMRISQNVVLTHEDKSYAGAFIASASIPWGYAKGDDDLGGYHLVWTRDMVQSASALLACGRVNTALRALVYLACTQKPDGSFAQNFWVNGTPYWTGIQLDEVAFPIILAWRLWKIGGLDRFDVATFAARAAGFLVRHAPVTQQERWEENAGYSPSTLAAVIAGLCCAAEIVEAHGEAELARFLEEHADWIQSHLEDWCVTNDGVLHPEIKRHYMRIRPPACGEPYANDRCQEGIVRLNNREPGEKYEFEAREIIDGGFLELVRYGIRRADDPVIVDSIKVVDHVLKFETPRGTCWRRYNHDGYGERKGGGPFLTWGQGRAWPLLTGERAHYELAAGHDVSALVKAFEAFASDGGMLPEQIWDQPNAVDTPTGHLKPGDSAGSAQPLVWAHAEYLKLLRSLKDGKVFDNVAAAEARYGAGPRASRIEIFKMRRKIHEMAAGKTLRIIAAEPFGVRWTMDNWQTHETTPSHSLGYAGNFADLPAETTQGGVLSFTLFWSAQKRWEGQNFDIRLVKE